MALSTACSDVIKALCLRLGLVLFLVVIPVSLVYALATAVYNVFFHPLRKYPGPTLLSITRIPLSWIELSGDSHRHLLKLHKKYGPIVRIAPNVLNYSHPDALMEIRGHRKAGKTEHQKDPYRHATNQDNILGADRTNHTRYRRSLANGFSHQSMLAQEPIIKKHVDKLFMQLDEACVKEGGPLKVDMMRWFNYTTFDIIGDLSFGGPFGCLDSQDYHPWVAIVFLSVKNLIYLATLKHYPLLFPLLKRVIIHDGLATKLAEHRQLSAETVRKRLSVVTDRPDFLTSMTSKHGSEALSFDELASNANVLILAGSETTATALTAATYYLTRHPEALMKLTAEVRSAFNTEDDIDLLSVQHLTYMLAVLDEAMRLFPPAPLGQPRVIGAGGEMILGQFVPEGTFVEVGQWVMYHNPAIFRQPDNFIPERWLGDERFVEDKREAFEPFSVGPRNCIGKNLAYSEMRLILARLIWKFDIELSHDSVGWDERSKTYLVYEKGPVDVYLTPRKKEEDRLSRRVCI